MLLELPLFWVVVLNILAWPAIHFGLALALTRVSESRFHPSQVLFRGRAWEREGELYQRLLGVQRWKRLLPDGAALFREGFPKKRLASREPRYLWRFARETCRSELAHWLMLLSFPVFLLWNEPWVLWIMGGYAMLANLPFIAVQRHNRLRLLALLPKEPTELGARASCPSGAFELI